MHWRFRHVDKLTDLVVLDALEHVDKLTDLAVLDALEV